MSGCAIFVPAILSSSLATAGSLAGGILIAGIALGRVLEWQSQERLEASNNANKRHQKIKEVQIAEVHLCQELERVDLAQQALQKKLNAISLSVNSAPSITTEKKARGFLGATEQKTDDLHDITEGLLNWLDQMDTSVKHDDRSPFVNLSNQLHRLLQESPDKDKLNGLLEVADASIKQFLSERKNRIKHEQRLLNRFTLLMKEVDKYAEITSNLSAQSELRTIYQSLHKQLFHGDTLTMDKKLSVKKLDILHKRFQKIRDIVEEDLGQRSLMVDMWRSTHEYLVDQGYKRLEGHEGEHQSLWRIPGGEQVMIHFEPDGKINSKIIHERIFHSLNPFSQQELAFIRQQEKRWCGDAKGLLRKMTNEGYQYQLHFEDMMPEEAIDIIVVEEIDEIIEDTEQAKPHMRHDT